jgi:hypothetical protein
MPKPSCERVGWELDRGSDRRRSAEIGRALLFVGMSFALRGAPCGHDAWHGPTVRGYHGQQPSSKVTADRYESVFVGRVVFVEPLDSETVPEGNDGVTEVDAVLTNIRRFLDGVSAVLEHTRKVPAGPYLSVASGPLYRRSADGHGSALDA